MREEKEIGSSIIPEELILKEVKDIVKHYSGINNKLLKCGGPRWEHKHLLKYGEEK